MSKVSNSVSVALSRVLLTVGVASTICVTQTLAADTQESQQDAQQQSESQTPDGKVTENEDSSSEGGGRSASEGADSGSSEDGDSSGGETGETDTESSTDTETGSGSSGSSDDMSSGSSGGGTGETGTESSTDTETSDSTSDGESSSGSEGGGEQAQQPTKTPETPAPATPTPPSIDTALENAKKELAPQLQSIFTLATQINDSNLDAQTKQALSTLKQDPKKFVAFIQSVENAAKSQASTSASSSANTAMNISNETSITARNVQHSNPYTFAKLLRDSKLASLTSDTARYYKMNNGGVWANTFGGANIIDGNNGSLYGISIGLDKQVSDSLLIGIYGTYSNATIKDTGAKNKANNFQLGFYTSYKFAPSWEFNAKVYGQSAKTDSESTLTTGIISADYTQKFFGASGNIGKILNPSEGFYLKPFVGLNYYYGYTPSYTEKGILAKQVRSISSNSLSLDVGAEFRNYINENSYLFITPKIEQYLTNNGDDYIANFVGATSTFSIENSDKNKTYGQVLVGGNMDINDSISLNAGIGVKHLLRGKVDSKDETYLSGNVGVKYKF